MSIKIILRFFIIICCLFYSSLPLLSSNEVVEKNKLIKSLDSNFKKKSVLLIKIHRGDMDKILFIRKLKDLFFKIRENDLEKKIGAIVFEIDDIQNGKISETVRFAVKNLGSLKFPIISFINTNASSASVIIACASDKIYMSPNSVIGGAPTLNNSQGTATSISNDGVNKSSKRNGKNNSSFLKNQFAHQSLATSSDRAQIRSVTKSKGRNPKIAEAFFNPNKEISLNNEIISERGELLAISANEATTSVEEAGKNNVFFADGIVKDLKELLEKEKLSDYVLNFSNKKELENFLNSTKKNNSSQSISSNISNTDSKTSADDSSISPNKVKNKIINADELKEDEIKLTKNRKNIYKDKVVVIKVGKKDLLRLPRFRFMRRIIKEAQIDKAEAIVFYIDTPGGLAWQTSELMIKDMQEVSIPTYAFVKKAISAGALIASAVDTIYMSPYSTIGAAAVVTSGGKDVGGSMEKKIYSTFRSLIRSICKQKGRRWEVVEAFMDKNVEVVIDGEIISKSGDLLSLDSEQAVRKYSDDKPLLAKGIINNLNELAKKENFKNDLIVAKPSMKESIAIKLTAIAGVLLLIGIIGAYVEIKAPGFGIAGSISVISFILFFSSFYIDKMQGVSAMIILFFIGVLLLLIEVFVIPGTLVFGAIGLFMIVVSILITMSDIPIKTPEVKGSGSILPIPTLDSLIPSMLTLLIVLLLAGIIISLLLKYFNKIPMFNWLVLKKEIDAGSGLYSSKNEKNNNSKEVEIDKAKNKIINKVGKSITDLRPIGKINVDGDVLDVTCDSGFIPKGTKVKVVEIEGMRIVVKKV